MAYVSFKSNLITNEEYLEIRDLLVPYKLMISQCKTKSSNLNKVYLDTSTKHMYELNNKIRLINISEYDITSGDMFVGFLLGIISGDHDIQQMYFDNFLNLSHTSMDELENIVKQLEDVSNKFGIDIYAAISTTDAELPASLSEKVIEAL